MEELLHISGGKFEVLLFTQNFKSIDAKRILLQSDGLITGEYRGRWYLYGDNYISLEIGGEEYLGVIMPAWIEHLDSAGIAISAMGRATGMAAHLVSTNKL